MSAAAVAQGDVVTSTDAGGPGGMDLNSLVEDILYMLATGEHPDRIVTRLGYVSRKALMRRLSRGGYAPLAAVFHRAQEPAFKVR